MTELNARSANAATPIVEGIPATSPDDEFNRRWVEETRPPQWVNPRPESRYHLVVIGGGTAGLVAAAAAAALGAKVALVERALLGGDCLNVGCVPSKALIAAARAVRSFRKTGEMGVQIPGEISVDFASIMRRLRRLRSEISPHDSAARFKSLGVDVFFGDARFHDSSTVCVGDLKLRFKKAVITTGARAAVPSIKGLHDVPCLTNESLFSLTSLPRRLAVVGAGPIGCEMAQSFAAFGADVMLIETAHGVLPREDSNAAALVRAALVRDGVRVLCCGRDLRFHSAGERARFTVSSHGESHDEEVDAVLVAVGRTPNVEGLNLEGVGVEFNSNAGIVVDDHLRTTNRDIFAAGDVCGLFKFTHAADFMARTVVRNALFFGRGRLSKLHIPWCTYTSPELAQVGLTAANAESLGRKVALHRQRFASNDRAILDGAKEGFVQVVTPRGSDQVLGATVVGEDAGEYISHFSLLMTQKIGLRRLAATIYPYPTRGEAVRRIGDLYNKSRLTPAAARLIRWWLRWMV